MQQKFPMNRGWLYKSTFAPADSACTFDAEGFETVDLPHTNKTLPYNYFDEASFQFISCYKKIFSLPGDLSDQKIFLDFEGVMTACEIWCNGLPAGSHKGGFTPFTIDLTSAAKPGRNVVVVRVDSTERPDIPPFGGVVDYLTFGGIYQEAELRITPQTRIERLWLTCPDPLAVEKTLCCECEITCANPVRFVLKVSLAAPDGTSVAESAKVFSSEAGTTHILAELPGLRDIALWNLDQPILYTVTACLSADGIQAVCTDRFGFRSAEFKPEGFFLNGKKVKLIGLNRHQSWPYVGFAMPKRIQRKDAELLKLEAGCSVVRTSHYPQSRHFLDACDELGLLVMEELPGWRHIGDLAWQNQAVKDLEDLITRDFNRPSIILWGVRINESVDCHDFYARTNEAAHRLDPIRQTGGVRYIRRSELLENVYTYNDFTHCGGSEVFLTQQEATGLAHSVPALVTESNGHMYPTKRFDQESRLTEHAMRHLRVIQEALLRDDLAGGISWCAFDYNTHGCFGSGDKICYHGVYDMFRNPKYAAFAYASQKNPDKGVILEPLTLASRGERDGGGLVPFQILTNCDFVRVHHNGSPVGDFYPDKAAWPGLSHPPVIVSCLLVQDTDLDFSSGDMEQFRAYLIRRLSNGPFTEATEEDLQFFGILAKKYGRSLPELIGIAAKVAGGWGDEENNLVLEGFVKGGTVCTRIIGEHKYAASITMEPDDLVLESGQDTYDATRITIRALDNMGGLMPFTQECVELSLKGPAELIGPARVPLTGGILSFWIRTLDRPGKVRITAWGQYSQVECRIQIN